MTTGLLDEPCEGTLRFSGHWILTNVCVTQADILASTSSMIGLSSAALRGVLVIIIYSEGQQCTDALFTEDGQKSRLLFMYRT